MRELVRSIMLTDTYRRGHLQNDATANELEAAEITFSASPIRRMLSEALFDSVVIAGHLESKKWRAGENVRVVSKQIRIPLGRMETTETDEGKTEMAMMTNANGDAMMSAGSDYSLETALRSISKKSSRTTPLRKMSWLQCGRKKTQNLKQKNDAAKRKKKLVVVRDHSVIN